MCKSPATRLVIGGSVDFPDNKGLDYAEPKRADAISYFLARANVPGDSMTLWVQCLVKQRMRTIK